MANQLIFSQLSSLEKVFLESDITSLHEVDGTTALKGERISYQILYTCASEKVTVNYHVDVDERIQVIVRTVGNVPCALPVRGEADPFYLRTSPGLYPDVLYETKEPEFQVIPGHCHSLFITCRIPENIDAGTYPVTVTFTCGENVVSKVFQITVIDLCLKKSDQVYGTIFHPDCVASYYKYKTYSSEHWDMIEKFIQLATDTGINMLYLPAFSNPNDTEIGKYRPPFQLVDVSSKNGHYQFGFEKLQKWLKICRNAGITKFLTAPLFSQWGTGCATQIIAETENGTKRIFGWHTDAFAPEYIDFLQRFLPEYISFLKKENVYDDMLFSCSDEPSEENIDMYNRQMDILLEFIPKEKFLEGLSEVSFAQKGIVLNSMPITSSIDKFIAENINPPFTYYCCIPGNEGYSNRFIAMPGGRTRITGFQLYKYGIPGFLHWGFNFYYSQQSRRTINPFLVTDADEGFPAGDPFIVYPGEEGPLESLRSVFTYEALQDYRACKLLEKHIGKESVNRIIDEDCKVTMNQYPRTNEGVLKIRERINFALEKTVRGVSS